MGGFAVHVEALEAITKQLGQTRAATLTAASLRASTDVGRQINTAEAGPVLGEQRALARDA